MEHFIFAVNSTLPVFLLMLVGWFLRRVNLFNDAFCRVADRYVFRVALPVSLFLSVAKMDIYTDFNLAFCLFCFGVTTVMFLGVWALAARFLKDKRLVGGFSQAAVRSSAAILGLALANNIYGSAGLVPMMIVAAVPFFNIYSVLILTFSPQVDANGELLPPATGGGSAVMRAVRGVATNPIIIGILLGLPFALLRLQLPAILDTTLSDIGKTATPIALLVVGASFSGQAAIKRWKPAAAASAVKLLILPALFLPLAALCGFRETAMIAILIMVGSPATVACWTMASNMHGDTTISSNIVVITTLFSSVTITLWLWALRAFGLV